MKIAGKESRLKFQVWLLILLVFALGAVTGASLEKIYSARPQTDLAVARGAQPQQPGDARFLKHSGPPLPPFIGQMQEQLKLTEEQLETIRGIMEGMRREFSPRRLEECPGFKEARLRIQTRINDALNPEQQQLFKEFTARREAEMNESSSANEPK